MNLPLAIERLRNVVRRQHKAIATEDSAENQAPLQTVRDRAFRRPFRTFDRWGRYQPLRSWLISVVAPRPKRADDGIVPTAHDGGVLGVGKADGGGHPSSVAALRRMDQSAATGKNSCSARPIVARTRIARQEPA